MGSATFPLARIYAVAAASCAAWTLVSLAVHLASAALWPGFRALRRSERRQWVNKWACGLHAAVLSAAQARNLFDPVLNADPLHGVTDGHFFWGSVLLGYLVYDTFYSLAFFPLRSGAVMLAHHAVGIAGCAIGVFANKLALFGLAIEVFFESCNPLLHVLGCMRIAQQTHRRSYALLTRLFVGQFFLFRVLISNGYMLWLLRCVLRERQRPWWAWAGVAVFALLNALNAVWLVKLVALLRREQRQQRRRRQQADGEAGKTTAAGGAGGDGSKRAAVAVHAVTYQPSAGEGEDQTKKAV